MSIVLFWGLALTQIALPGLYYDEALDAVPAVQLVQGQPVEAARDAVLRLGPVQLPLMVMEYVGPLNTYLLVPLFELASISTLTLRWLPVAGGAVTIALAFALARRAFGEWTAVVAALLLATHPSFLFWTRQGIHVTSLMAPLALGALAALWWAGERRRLWLWGLGGLLLGLGLTAKLLFLWFIVALAALGPAARALALRRRPPSTLVPGPKGLLAVVAGLLVGTAPLLLYNVLTQGTLQALAASRAVTPNGVDNSAYLSNLVTRLDNLRTLLDGSSFWYLGGIYHQRLLPWAVLVAAALAVAAILSQRTSPGERARLGGLLGLMALVYLQSGVTISGLWATHYYLLLPFALSLVAWAIGQPARGLRGGVLASSAVLAVLLGANLWTDLRYHRALAQTGGQRAHSDGIERLAEWLEDRPDRPVYALDWGMRTSVYVLTGGRVSPVEIFQYAPEPLPSFRDWLYGALHTPGALFLFRSPDMTAFHRWEHFQRWTTEWGLVPVLETTVTERNGTPLYFVYSVRPAP